MSEEANEQDLIRQAASLMGRRKSEKKTAAVRENGKKGGRPKGIPMSEEAKAKAAATRARNKQEGTTEG